MADWFQQAGLAVVRYEGWTTRARSSGGYEPGRPLCVMWHHTASSASPQDDAYYMCHTSSDRPICNVMVDRAGTVWCLAAGATNTNGKGDAKSFSRGTVPANSMNSYAVGMEICNNGIGEDYPQVQIDAAFVVSNVLNANLGNQPGDVCTHQDYAPTRKIDPAVGSAVRGPWQPREINYSGTWSLDDLRAECGVRAGQRPPDPVPGPEPTPPPEEDWMANLPTIKKGDNGIYVLRMQHLLSANGYMNPANQANFDGAWGDGTDGAKQRFDTDHGLLPSPPTDCGDKSWRALMGA
jgi:hypothetical protein